jgi:hypothetical protein
MEILRVTLVLVGVLLVLFPSSLVDVRVRGVLWMNGCVPNRLSFCAFKSSVALPLMFWRCVLMPVAWGTVVCDRGAAWWCCFACEICSAYSPPVPNAPTKLGLYGAEILLGSLGSSVVIFSVFQ